MDMTPILAEYACNLFQVTLEGVDREVARRTVNGELALHRVRTHLLTAELGCIVIHVLEIVLKNVSMVVVWNSNQGTYLKFAIADDSLGELSVQVLLIGHPSTKPLLPQHLP